MGKSTRKTPIVGITTTDPDTDDKHLLNRSLCRINHQILKTDENTDSLKQVKEVIDPWKMAKNGKVLIDPIKDTKPMRKYESEAVQRFSLSMFPSAIREMLFPQMADSM